MNTRRPLQIFVVNDCPVNEKLMICQLTRMGWEVQGCLHAREAVKTAAQKSFTIIFMDIEMPVMDGIAASMAIRDFEKEAGTSNGCLKNPVIIIAVSAHSDDAYRSYCLENGMDDYISKPVTLRLLLTTIQKWFPDFTLKNDTAPTHLSLEKPENSAAPLDLNKAPLDIVSSQLTIAGTGWVDFPEKKIEMEMNLTTQSKKNINKIPLVGYILVGKEKKPSITMKVSGDLLNPDVEHAMFREVATLPFGILFRTLALPAHLVSPIFTSDDDGDQPEEE